MSTPYQRALATRQRQFAVMPWRRTGVAGTTRSPWESLMQRVYVARRTSDSTLRIGGLSNYRVDSEVSFGVNRDEARFLVEQLTEYINDQPQVLWPWDR